jgi:hypothetical protein
LHCIRSMQPSNPHPCVIFLFFSFSVLSVYFLCLPCPDEDAARVRTLCIHTLFFLLLLCPRLVLRERQLQVRCGPQMKAKVPKARHKITIKTYREKRKRLFFSPSLKIKKGARDAETCIELAQMVGSRPPSSSTTSRRPVPANCSQLHPTERRGKNDEQGGWEECA